MFLHSASLSQSGWAHMDRMWEPQRCAEPEPLTQTVEHFTVSEVAALGEEDWVRFLKTPQSHWENASHTERLPEHSQVCFRTRGTNAHSACCGYPSFVRQNISVRRVSLELSSPAPPWQSQRGWGLDWDVLNTGKSMICSKWKITWFTAAYRELYHFYVNVTARALMCIHTYEIQLY